MSEEKDDPGPLISDIVGDVTCPWRFLGKRLVDAVVGAGLCRRFVLEKFGSDEVPAAQSRRNLTKSETAECSKATPAF